MSLNQFWAPGATRYQVPPFTPVDSDPCFCTSGRSFGQCCGSRAERRPPPGGVSIVPGFLDRETCKKLINRLERQDRVRATTTHIENAVTGKLVYLDDPARVCDTVNPGVLRKKIINHVAAAYQQVIGRTGRSLAWFEFPHILRYKAGGFYLHHSDSCIQDSATRNWFKIQDRDLSLLLYLNEDFTGGGLTFTKFNYHFRPRTGDLLIFPSDNRYEHQAEEVRSGVRYVVVSWASFTGSRRVAERPPDGAIPVQAPPPNLRTSGS